MFVLTNKVDLMSVIVLGTTLLEAISNLWWPGGYNSQVKTESSQPNTEFFWTITESVDSISRDGLDSHIHANYISFVPQTPSLARGRICEQD